MHAFANGEANILGADIVLEVDESLGRGVVGAGAFGAARHAARPFKGLGRGDGDGGLASAPAARASNSPTPNASSIVACIEFVPLQAPTDMQSSR